MRSRRSVAHQGFTLIELLIVIIIIGILAAVAIPLYLNERDHAKDAAVKEGVHIIQDAVMTYAAGNGGAYPPTEYVTYTPNDSAADNLGNKYLDKWPINPWTGKPMANTGSSVLFNTNFSSMAGLTPLSGNWTVVNGQLVAPKDKNGQATGGGLLFGSTSWGDVQLDVNATLNSGPGLGVYFRSDGKVSATNAAGVNAGYCFQIDPGLGNKFVVRKWVNGVESAPLASASMSSAFVASMNTVPHDIKISAVGDHIVVTVDGVVVLDFHDSTYATGSAGLRAWYGSNVNFISANAQGGGGTAGAGAPNKGDFAYAFGSQSTAYGLVGWTSGGGAWVVQPLQ
jgi:type II secretion system protein G